MPVTSNVHGMRFSKAISGQTPRESLVRLWAPDAQTEIDY